MLQKLSPPEPLLKGSVAACAAILLTACASRGPDRPPPRGGSGENDAQRISYQGFAAKPIALLFTSMDQNADQRVSVDEFEVSLGAEWAALSEPGRPGALDFSKWATAALGSPDALPNFISFDRNLDGILSKTEFTDYLTREFVSLDTNFDEALDRSELLFRIEPARARESGGRTSQGGGRESGGRPPR